MESRLRSGRPRPRVVLTIATLVVAACSSPDSAAFPLIGLDHPDAVFAGGNAVTDLEFGPSYELQWALDGGYVEITGSISDSESFDQEVERRAEAADPGESEAVVIRGFEAHHIIDTRGADHTFMWYEGGAVVRVRIHGLESRVDEVLDALATMDDEWLERTSGGWIDSDAMDGGG